VGYINLICATSLICHNATTLSNINLLILTFTLLLVYICKLNHIQNLNFHTLVNSRSIYYFVNTAFTNKYNISTILTSLNNTTFETAFLPIIFPYSHQIILNMYITSLDFSWSLVLRYNWIIQHNPLIYWTTRSIIFQSSLKRKLIFWKNF